MKKNELKECFEAMKGCDSKFTHYALFIFESQWEYDSFVKLLPSLEDEQYNYYHSVLITKPQDITYEQYLGRVKYCVENNNMNVENCLPLMCGVYEKPFVYNVTPLVIKSEKLHFDE